MEGSNVRKKRSRSGVFFLIYRRVLALKLWQVLLFCYLLFSALRAVLAFQTTLTPVVQPDEAMYLHLSSSIIREGALLFRGQPIGYEYILYPLLLSPLHLLPEGVSIFRAAQVLNALVMNLAVFPAYALARDITGSRKRGLLIALLTLLMPDFFMTRQVMTESLGFPLILTTCWAYLKYYNAPPRFRTALLWGALGFLLYALKPGHLALPVCFYLILIFRTVRNRQWGRLLNTLTSVLIIVGFYGLYRLLLVYGLNMLPDQSTLYQSQTHPLTWAHLAQMINGLFMYGVYVPLAFAFYPLLLPITHLRAFETRERDLLLAFLLALFTAVLGTVYIIYYDELFDGFKPYEARIHVRYISVYLPVLTAFLFSPRLDGRRLNAHLFAGLTFSVVGILLLGSVPIGSGQSYNTDALLLAIATFKTEDFSGRLLWPAVALTYLMTAAFLMHRRGWDGLGRRLLCGFLLLSFICSSAVAAWNYRYHEGSPYPAAAPQALALTEGKHALGVVRDTGFLWPEALELDLASRFRMPVVELDDLIAHTSADGSIGAFLPKAYWQEQPTYALDSPASLVLVGETLNRIILSQTLAANSQTTLDAAYTVARLDPGTSWLHSGLSGFDEGWVKEGSRFTLFDAALRAKGAMTLRLQARMGEGEGALLLTYGDRKVELPLTAMLNWVETTFPIEDPSQPVTVFFTPQGGNGQVYVETYLVE